MRTFSFFPDQKSFCNFLLITGKGKERKIIIRNEQWTSSSFAIFISRPNFFCLCQLPRGSKTWEMLKLFHLIRRASFNFPHSMSHFLLSITRRGSSSNWNFKVESCGLVDFHITHNDKTHIHTGASSIVFTIAFIFTSCCIFIPRHNLLWFQLNRVITFAVEACLRARWFCL